MNKLDAERLVRKLAILDNRQVNDGVIESWYELVGHLSYGVAELALQKARQDVNINWVEPKHIIAKSHDAIAELNAEAAKLAREADESGTGSPEPKCEAHGLRITKCVPCCKAIYEKSLTLGGERLEAWCIGNVYEQVAF